MKILVTGSSGHLGEALIRTLRSKDRRVIGADVVPSEFTNEVGSIVDRHFVQRCMESVDAVIHAATLHKPMSSPTVGKASLTTTSQAR
jgi:UDP-glucose 4-epimerase